MIISAHFVSAHSSIPCCCMIKGKTWTKMEFLLTTVAVLTVSFCTDFFGSVGKQLDKKAENIFKIYDVTDYEANNYNTHTAQYLQK